MGAFRHRMSGEVCIVGVKEWGGDVQYAVLCDSVDWYRSVG